MSRERKADCGGVKPLTPHGSDRSAGFLSREPGSIPSDSIAALNLYARPGDIWRTDSRKLLDLDCAYQVWAKTIAD